jgi:hypothetical protein
MTQLFFPVPTSIQVPIRNSKTTLANVVERPFSTKAALCLQKLQNKNNLTSLPGKIGFPYKFLKNDGGYTYTHRPNETSPVSFHIYKDLSMLAYKVENGTAQVLPYVFEISHFLSSNPNIQIFCEKEFTNNGPLILEDYHQPVYFSQIHETSLGYKSLEKIHTWIDKIWQSMENAEMCLVDSNIFPSHNNRLCNALGYCFTPKNNIEVMNKWIESYVVRLNEKTPLATIGVLFINAHYNKTLKSPTIEVNGLYGIPNGNHLRTNFIKDFLEAYGQGVFGNDPHSHYLSYPHPANNFYKVIEVEKMSAHQRIKALGQKFIKRPILSITS